MNISIDGRWIGAAQPPYVIAELSANHNGSIERALATIEAAKNAGADAIKLQTYTPDTITIDCDKSDFLVKGGLWDGYKLYDLYKWAHTPFEWHEEMFAHARKVGVTVFSTPFDETAVDLLEQLGAPAYKIASFELVDIPLIRYVAQTGKPMILSTGMASEWEIEEAVENAREAGCSDLILLHCVSSYPTPINQARLRNIPRLADRFGVISGLSDHTLGITASVASVALGACVIEKHFTLSRAEAGPDSEFSIEPDQLEDLCRETLAIWTSLGSGDFERPDAESGNQIFRRSIYFVRDLSVGDVVGAEDIRRIRPGYGLPPKLFDSLIGKKLRRSVDRGTATSIDDFE